MSLPHFFFSLLQNGFQAVACEFVWGYSVALFKYWVHKFVWHLRLAPNDADSMVKYGFFNLSQRNCLLS